MYLTIYNLRIKTGASINKCGVLLALESEKSWLAAGSVEGTGRAGGQRWDWTLLALISGLTPSTARTSWQCAQSTSGVCGISSTAASFTAGKDRPPAPDARAKAGGIISRIGGAFWKKWFFTGRCPSRSADKRRRLGQICTNKAQISFWHLNRQG